MTTRTPLPPLPDITDLANHPVYATLLPRLLGPRPGVAMYEDSPYIAPAADSEPPPGDEDDGPWCAARQT